MGARERERERVFDASLEKLLSPFLLSLSLSLSFSLSLPFPRISPSLCARVYRESVEVIACKNLVVFSLRLRASV